MHVMSDLLTPLFFIKLVCDIFEPVAQSGNNPCICSRPSSSDEIPKKPFI